MYSTRTRVHARIPNGLPREEKRASDKSPPTSRPARGKLNGPRARGSRPARCSGARRGTPRRLPREDPREKVGEEVRVSVGFRVGPVEFKLYRALGPQLILVYRQSARR